MALNDLQIANLGLLFSISEDAICESGIGANLVLGAPITTLQNTNTLIPPDASNPYLELITSYHQGGAKFLKLVELLTQGFWQNTILVDNFYHYFDLNYAVGHQLDIIGQWVGISRDIKVPLSGEYFSFNVLTLGFDEGYWDQALGTANSVLDDNDYRRVIRAKIALNMWDGTVESAQNALLLAMPTNPVYISDWQNMSMTLMIAGLLTPVNFALITQGYFDLRPSGVKISYATAETFFAWDQVNGNTIQGWNTGQWYHAF